MKRCAKTLDEMIGPIPDEIEKEVALSFEISDRIDELMRERGLANQ
jgi:hypothetical protein